MPNTSAAFGARPVRFRDGAPYQGEVTMYYIPSTDSNAMYVGDPVITAGSADAAGVQTCLKATAAGGAYLNGFIVGFVPNEIIPSNHRVASTNRYCLVADSRGYIFAIQEDAVGGALAATNVGQNCDLVSGSGSDYTGLSGWMLDSSTANTTNTLQMRIEGFDPNDFGTSYQTVWCSINLHTHGNTTGT